MNSKAKIFLILLAVVFSCTEDITPTPPTFYQIITGKTKKTWKITGLKWTGVGKTDVTYNVNNFGCYTDDQYSFYANTENLYDVDGGSKKCSTDERSPLVTDSWSFVNATATLTIIIPLLSDNELPFYVQKVSSKEMTLVIYLDQDNKYSYVITMQSVSEQ